MPRSPLSGLGGSIMTAHRACQGQVPASSQAERRPQRRTRPDWGSNRKSYVPTLSDPLLELGEMEEKADYACDLDESED